MEKQNYLLDFLKGIGCFGVVFIHVRFPGILGDIIWRLAQFAVPMFFMISGFYAYSVELSYTGSKISRRMKRLFRISIISTGIYALLRLLMWIAHGCLQGGDIHSAVIAAMRFLLLNDVDFLGCGHLWFLWALTYAYGVLWWVNKKDCWGKAHRSLIGLFLLYVLAYVARFYWGMSWHVTGNWLVGALPFVLLGHFIASQQRLLEGFWTNAQLMVTVVVGAVISLAFLAKPALDFSVIGLIVYAVSMFLLAVKNPGAYMCRPLVLIGAKYSLYIYVFHVLVSLIFRKALKMVGGSEYAIIQWILPVAVAISSFMLACGCVYVVDKRFCLRKG